jgi:serine/threonine-protein kinase RsbT
MPGLRLTSLCVERGDTLVLASDGLRSDFARGLWAEDSPEQLASGILARSAKGTDDACVLVARYLRDPSMCLPIRHPADVAGARLKVRELALRRGFNGVGAEALATAVSELSRNALVHAGGGELCVAYAARDARRGLEVVARDHGPGIADLALALTDGWSSTGSLGLGLSGARRFADEFELASTPGQGTTVTLRKWLP